MERGAGGKDEAGDGGIWRWLRRNEVRDMFRCVCVFVVESQLLSPRGFKQLSRTVITHTYTHLLCSPSPYLSTPFIPSFPFFISSYFFFSFNPILGPASSVFAHFFSSPSPFLEIGEERLGTMVRKGEGKRKEAWEAGGTALSCARILRSA